MAKLTVLIQKSISMGKIQKPRGIEKALSHKYIRRWPKASGKGWNYLYPSDFLKPIKALFAIFKVDDKKVTDIYEENSIKKDYGADKKTFAAHVLEYLSNRPFWDTFFSDKKNRDKFEKPRKPTTGAGGGGKKTGAPKDKAGGGAKKTTGGVDSSPKQGYTQNRSLMRKVWSIFNKQEKRADERDNTGNGQVGLPTGTPAVRAGSGKESGDRYVPGAKTGDNAGESLQLPGDVGERTGGDVRTGRNARLTKKETKNIREACLALLNSKYDSEMTEADKDLLRQYEGAGGLGENEATTHGILYEFYTPVNITKKVWQLVDKYIPGEKSVLEPSAGIGRFAEDRPNDKFTLNEFDAISSRISGILHPNAENKHGAFQEFFKPGKPYTGNKFDVVIGNPPFGKYEGLFKGKGEGKDHTRYEEYFIERGLDTLREGGVMAFVVPSGFLRGADSKIKQRIAEKGKLMEAWRLPNGTFNTTQVGTDIIVIRKEKGDPAQFSDNAFFDDHPDMIMGEETTRIGRFGEEQYCALPQGESFDEAIDRINSEKVEAPPLGKPTTREEARESVKTKVTDKNGKSRSEAMEGNDNAKNNNISEIDRYIEIGGNEWIKGEKHRIYFNGKALENLYGLKISRYGSGGIKGAWKDGEKISNNKAFSFMMSKPYYDVKEGKFIGLYGEIAENLKQSIAVPDNKDNEKKDLSDAMKGNQNAAGKHDVDTTEEFNAKYNKHIAQEALPVWMATQWDRSIDMTQLNEKSKNYVEKSGNYVKGADDKWYDIVNFASGNIYEKLEALERDKELLPKKEYERQKAILEEVLPKQKTVLDFEISPLSDISENFMTSEVANLGQGAEPMPLNEAFKRWIRQVPREELALTPDASVLDVMNFVDRTRVTAARSTSQEEREANRAEADRRITARREAAERLFNQYVREQLSLDDQKRLAEQYNRQYNGTVQADYTKIPVFLNGISKTFKGNDFKANESQMKGTSWLSNQGNGIVAFDVGVGKTITAIMAAMNDIQMGRCKKPIITVPKSVYKNWIAEISQLFPGIKINALGNFGEIGKYKDENGNLKIEDGSISLCTYEALVKIGFKDETLQGELRESFSEALTTVTDADYANAGTDKNGKPNKASRKIAQEDEKIMTQVGKASRTGDNWINWEDSGFDHITVDEGHNFRNSFSKPHTKFQGDADEFKEIPGGSSALRGLKLFAIAQMVQKHNNGRNVHVLTATPFQNSPVEIYNMLSLVAREQLKQAGIYNFHEFLAQFAELKAEISVDSKGNIVQKNVMKGFKNLQALQGLLNQYIMKIDGEDAGIVRPDKKDHIIPLNPTAEQRDITEKIRAYMEAGPDQKEDPGATLRCINALRQAALSPALVDGFEFLDPIAKSLAGIQEDSIKVQNKDFIKSSPKLSFICDSLSDIYKNHPDKGQIIHLPQGVSHYPDVKKYLVSKGIPADAIAFLAPEHLKTGDAGNDQKEEITAAFNDPNNKLKIIIGSDTIKEGVNLNGNTIQTYEAMLAWNPTDTQQLKGRSWRQGNKQGRVHMTFPLMNDSVDSFMYQKHDEKGTRLDTLWKSKKEKLEIEEIDPEELKFSLIKDPKKRADLFIKEKTADLTQKQKIAEATSDKIFKMAGERKEYEKEMRDYQADVSKMRQALLDFNAKSDADIIKENDLEFNSSYQQSIYDDYVGARGKNIKELRENYVKAMKNEIADHQKTAQRNKGKMDTIDNTLKRYGIDDAGNMATVERIQKRYSSEAQEYNKQIEAIEANREKYIADAAAKIKAETRPGVSVSEAVSDIIQMVTGKGQLYSMQEVIDREKGKSGETVKKSFNIVFYKRIKVRVGK